MIKGDVYLYLDHTPITLHYGIPLCIIGNIRRLYGVCGITYIDILEDLLKLTFLP